MSQAQLAAQQSSGLFPRYVDALLIGGLSLIFYLFVRVSLDPTPVSGHVSWFVFSLSYIVNFPHFLASYHLLYFDFRKQIFKKPRYLLAGVIAPLVLVGCLVYGFSQRDVHVLGYMVNAMFFFVGWHYVKQVFGIFVVYNGWKGFRLGRDERMAIKINLYAVWLVSWVGANTYARKHMFEGVPYTTFSLPPAFQDYAYVLLGFTALSALFTFAKRYVETGDVPDLVSVIAVLSLYIWFVPAIAHPRYSLMIPFFHSLQYLVFIFSFRFYKAKATSAQSEDGPVGRRRFLVGFWGYLALTFVTGALFMRLVPVYLDQLQSVKSLGLGPTPFFFALTLFINIHHYFIDHAIWRHDNDEMKTYLFSRSNVLIKNETT